MESILVTGGCRSGKSDFALSLVKGRKKRFFVATAQALDDEMARRIEAHRQARGEGWTTLEVPLDLPGALAGLPSDGVALVDCSTVWSCNVMSSPEVWDGESCGLFDRLVQTAACPPCDLIFVTNELGMGIVPADPFTRRYRDVTGRLNQRIAAACSQAWLVVCGLPVRLK